jgi:hypothetical protein
MPRASAVLRIASIRSSWAYAPGIRSEAMRRAEGMASRRSSIHFGAKSWATDVTALTLPPGRARLFTNPLAAGSSPLNAMTIGIVLVAAIAARIAAGATATMTPSLAATSSFASSGSRSALAFANRISNSTLRPST